MNTRFLPALLLTLLAVTSQAAVFEFNGINAGIPDGNPAGWSDTRSITLILRPGESASISDLNVNLNISGGYNGDLYAYLVHSSGFAVLLNRSGRTGGNPLGYSDPGFNITFDDQNGTDIHLYSPNNTASALTGTWAVDGRNVNPLAVTSADARTALLSSFNGLDPNGTWTLFLADMSGGDQSTLMSWGLNITVVPEPTTVALLVFGAVAIGVWVQRRLRASRRPESMRTRK